MSHPLPPRQIEEILKTLQSLPADRQQQVVDFIEFVAARSAAEWEEDWFWGLVGLIDFELGGVEAALQPLTTHLSSLPDEEIFRFHDILSDKLQQLDTPEHFKVAGGSADTFLYGRCLVVAEGKKYFHTVLNNLGVWPKDHDLEDLLYVPEIAFETKNNAAYPHTPRSVYETGWNKAAWGEKAVSFA